MLILVSGATKTTRRLAGHKHLGALITPQAGNLPPHNMPWAADNAAYSNWDQGKFLNMLDKLSGCLYNPPVWVAAPDVVGDAIATAKKFMIWQPIIKMHGLPVALVLQNGQESIGWATHERNFDAIFIGGDDEFKLGGYVRYCVKKAKAKGKWVHMGRVNSLRRIDYAREIGCDSVDGTACSMYPEAHIPKFLRHLEREQLAMGFYA